jgi:hypothetical protein
MREQLKGSILGLVAAMAISPAAFGQGARAGGQANGKAAQAKTAGGAKAPAPRRDISGVWYHEGAGARFNKKPPLTPLGQKLFSMNKSKSGGTDGAVTVAESNDPWIKCDPLGFPRTLLDEIRGMEFVAGPTKMFQFYQYQKAWREIWTDGRSLPKGFGSDVHAPDPRYYGYSVGRWEGDNTFVVETVGMDDRSWLDNDGHPHSIDLHVEERYTRPDHDNLQVAVKIDDPKIYAQPYVAATVPFTWNPKQEFEEQLCIPSEAQAYFDAVASPARPKK